MFDRSLINDEISQIMLIEYEDEISKVDVIITKIAMKIHKPIPK